MSTCEQVAEAVAQVARRARAPSHYKYMCSDPGPVADPREDRIASSLTASSSPPARRTCTCKTFRKAAAAAGLNPYLVEMANIREHCSWVHHDQAKATAKAIDLIRMSVAKVRRNHALEPIRVPVTQAGAGDRRRRGGHSGRARHRRRRLRGRAGRTRAVDRRQDGRPLRDLPHAGLLAVHPHAADGRRRPAPEHQAAHVLAKSRASRATSAISR